MREYTEDLFNGSEAYWNQEEIKKTTTSDNYLKKRWLYIVRENGILKILATDELNEEMERLGFDGLNVENVGVIVDFGSESEDDEWERKQIEKEDEEIRDFEKCHSMPSPDDEEGDKFWKKVNDRMKEAEGVNGMHDNIFII